MKSILTAALLLLSLSVYAQKSMWLLAGQSNASGMGDRRSSLKYTVPVCFDYVQTGDSLRVLQDPVGENGKFFGKANSGSIAPSFAWHLNKLTGDSIVIGFGGLAAVAPARPKARRSTVPGPRRERCRFSMLPWKSAARRSGLPG